MRTDRGISTVVEKTLAVGLVTLFISMVSVTVYGGVVPDARTATGEELADRTLAKASERIQQAVPPNTTASGARIDVHLPPTIRGSGYHLRADGQDLVLDHPRDTLDSHVRLALPPHVLRIEGQWESGGPTAVTVEPIGNGVVIRLDTEAET